MPTWIFEWAWMNLHKVENKAQVEDKHSVCFGLWMIRRRQHEATGVQEPKVSIDYY